MERAVKRAMDFAPQSLIEVRDALDFFGDSPPLPNAMDGGVRAVSADIADYLLETSKAWANRVMRPSQMDYKSYIEGFDVMTLGVLETTNILHRVGVLATAQDPFAKRGREAIATWRAEQIEIDPRSKTTYNNAVNYIATGKPELEVQGQGAVLAEKKRNSKAY